MAEDVRAELEQAAQFALDTAERLLDGMDGEPDDNTGGAAKPKLRAG